MSNIFDESEYTENSKTQKEQAHLLFSKVDEYEPKEVSNILDIGCGDGFLTKKLSEKYPEAYVKGIDSSEYQIGNCPNVEGVEFEVVKFPNSSLKNNFYDIIFSNATLHWIDNQEQVYSKIEDILSKGGITCIHQGHNGCYKELKEVARDIIENEYNVSVSGWEYPINYHNKESLKQVIFGNSNLEILDIDIIESDLPETIFEDYSQAGLNNFKKLLPDNLEEEFTQLFVKEARNRLDVEEIDSKRLYFVLRKS